MNYPITQIEFKKLFSTEKQCHSYLNSLRYENLNYYLDEYAFRYNRRRAKSRGYLFYVLLKQSVLHKPVYECEILKTELKQ